MSGRNSAYDRATRERAIELAEREGNVAASRQLGIPRGTIRRWRHEVGRISQVPTHEARDPEGWAQRKREGASDTWTAARRALDRVHALLAGGDERKAKDAALTMAILLDKSAALEQASALADEREAKLNTEQAQAIVDAIMRVFKDLGVHVSASDAIARLVKHHLLALSESTDDPGPAPDEDASSARDQLRRSFEREMPPVTPIAALPAGDPEPEEPRKRPKRVKAVVEGEGKPVTQDPPDRVAAAHWNDELWKGAR